MKCRCDLSFAFCMAFFMFIVCLGLHCLHSSATTDSKELVVSLELFNFTNYVAKHDYILLHFYHSGCDNCKRFSLEFEKAASILSKEDPLVVFAKVDTENAANRILVDVFKADFHPTIKILKKGGGRDITETHYYYNGPLTANSIVTFVNKERGPGPASLELQSHEEIARLVADKKTVIVGFFPEFSGEKYENFTDLTERLRNKYEYELRHTSDAKLLATEDSSVTSSMPVVRMFKPFDEPFLDFLDFDVDSLEDAIEESSGATIAFHDHDSRNRPYLMKFLTSGDSKVLMIINSSASDSMKTDSLKAEFQHVAYEYKGKGIRFSIVDLDANDVELHGPKDDEVPLLYILTNDGKIHAKPKIEPDQISAWLLEFLEESEPIPETNDEPVKATVIMQPDSKDDL